MSKTTVKRQNLIEVVNDLPDEVLVELANFMDYLRYKTTQRKKVDISGQNFLLSITGIGNSGEEGISDSDEEILRNEQRIEHP